MAKRQWEVEAMDRFLRFMNERYGQAYAVSAEDVIVNPVTRRDFDYELSPSTQGLPVIALEIFRMVGEEQELGQHRSWLDVALRLTTELKSRGVSGYLIRTPHFDIPKYKRKQFARETAEVLASAIANHPDEKEFEADGYMFYKLPGDPEVRFSHIGQVRQINPFGSVSDALDNSLPVKNDQLNTQGRVRTLLILNAGVFPHEKHDVRQYFSTKALEEFPNIDRVFFEAAPGQISLVFDRRAFNSFREENIPDDEELADLFFNFVAHRLSFRDPKAFGVVTKIFEKYGSLGRLSTDGKDALISCGDSFVEDGDWRAVLWIIERLKNDPDPPFPNPMHNEIEEGEDYRLIVSIRGRLCWLIQKVVVHNLLDYYSAMLDILEGYASGKDFYIRSQACVPLSEMAVKRRQKLPDDTRFMPEEIAQRIKAIALKILRDAGKNPALLDDVSNVLRWMGDFNEKEATEVIDRLSSVGDTDGVHNRCGLLLYFSLFREGQFSDLPRFDPSYFQAQLHRELADGEPRFRTSLMWQMAGGAEDKTFDYDLIRPYLRSFVSGPYCDGAYSSLHRIFVAHIKEHAKDLCPVMVAALAKTAEHIAEDPASRHWKVYDLQDSFGLIAAHCGEEAVLDSVDSLLKHRTRIPGFVADVTGILAKHKSARAQELARNWRTAKAS